MITLEEAQRIVHGACAAGLPLPPRSVGTRDALGCVLASPARALVDVPPFANSGMDGYAVRAADVVDAPVTLRVVGRVLAGSTLGAPIGPGEAARIMTGAPIPDGADAVCMVERTAVPDGAPTDASGVAGSIVIERSVAAGENVRGAGDDVRAGETVLDAGTYVGPTQLAAVISAGCATLEVHPRPRVGVVSTGDELVDLGGRLGPAQIFDSNRPMLLASIADAGADPVDLGRSGDDEEQLAALVRGALGHVDALVLSGGVSVGDVDVVRIVLERLTSATRWMQIAIRPAKPFSFTILEDRGRTVPVFGLPGNPVSSAVSFELLVRPILRALAGHAVTARPRWRARAAVDMPREPDGRLYLVRVQLRPPAGSAGSSWEVWPCPGQGSHQIRSMGLADGLALLPDGKGVEAGSTVDVLVTNPGLAPALAAG